MVCKKCGKTIMDTKQVCPYCGVGQNHSINLSKFNRELEDLKIGNNSSSFSSEEEINFNGPIDVEEIIEDLEELKIKEKDEEEKILPRVELVSDEVLEEVIENINENKELFRKDRSYINYNIKPQQKEEQQERKEISDYPRNQAYIPVEKINNNFKEEKEPIVVKNKNKISTKYFDLSKINSRLIKATLIVLALILVVLFTTYKLVLSPQARLFKNFDEFYNQTMELVNKIEKNYSILNNKDIIEINSTSKVNKTINNVSTNEILNTKYVEDTNNKRQYYEYTNLNNNKSSITKVFVQNNKFYVNKDNSSEDFYVTDGNYVSIIDYLNKKNIEDLYKTISKNVKDQLTNHKFSSISVEKKLNEKTYKLKEHTLNIKTEDSKKIVKQFLENLKKDNTLTNLSKYTNTTKQELKSKIDKIIQNLGNNKLTYKFYLDENNKLVMQNLEYQHLKINHTIIDSVHNLEITYNDNTYKLVISNKNNNFNIKVRYNLEKEFIINIHKQNNKLIINYQITEPAVEDYQEVNIIQKRKVVNIISKIEKNKNSYRNNLSISISSNLKDENIAENIETVNTIKEIDNFPQLKLNNPNQITLMDNTLKNKYKTNFSMFIK